MSRTESVHHSPEYWRYTAQAMDELLSDTLKTSEYASSGFHDRVLGAALAFLDIALGNKADREIEDPSASIANFGLAARALRGISASSEAREATEANVEAQLSNFVCALQGLRSGSLDREVTEALPNLQQFFHQVFAAADSESYVARVLHDPKLPMP